MSFTYDFTTAPLISYVRLLIPDTNAASPIFQDDEITAFYFLQQNVYQSSMKYSFPAGQYLPSAPVSYLRVAAMALTTLANNSARLSSVIGLLDVKLDPSKAAQALRDAAAELRCIDDDSGAIFIIEQCTTQWGFIDRYWSQVQRQSSM